MIKKSLSISALCLGAFLFTTATPLQTASAQSTGGTTSVASSHKAQWDEYCEYFYDQNSNFGWSGCPDKDTDGLIVDGDIDIQGLLFRDTIVLDDDATYAALTAMIRNLTHPTLRERVPDTVIPTSNGREHILLEQQLISARTIAADTIAGIIARRTSVPLSEKDQERSTPTHVGEPLPAVQEKTSTGAAPQYPITADPAETGTKVPFGEQRTAALNGSGSLPPCNDEVTGGGPNSCGKDGYNQDTVGLTGSVGRDGVAIILDSSCPYFSSMQNATPGSYIDSLNNVGRVESGGKYYHRNKRNQLGKYQLGEAVLIDIGCVCTDSTDADGVCTTDSATPDGTSNRDNRPNNNDYGSGEPEAEDRHKSTSFDGEAWNTTCPARSRVTSVSGVPADLVQYFAGENGTRAPKNSKEFLMDPCTQESAKRAYDLRNLQRLDVSVLREFMCKTISGPYKTAQGTTAPEEVFKPNINTAVIHQSKPVVVTPSGVMYAAHLFGAGGVNQAFLSLGGEAAFDATGIQGRLWDSGQGNGNAGGNGRSEEDFRVSTDGVMFTDENFMTLAQAIARNNGYESLLDNVLSDIECVGGGEFAEGFRPPQEFVGEPPRPAVNKIRSRPGHPVFNTPFHAPVGAPKSSSERIQEIRNKAGVDPKRIGQHPSYNEMMLSLTKERFLIPSYFIQLSQSDGGMLQEQTWTEAYIAIQLKDIYQIQEQINVLLAARASLELAKEPLPDLESLKPFSFSVPEGTEAN